MFMSMLKNKKHENDEQPNNENQLIIHYLDWCILS